MSKTKTRAGKKRIGEERIYTVEEVAALMKSSRSTVYEMIKTGRLRAVDFGGYRITESALEEAIENLSN